MGFGDCRGEELGLSQCNKSATEYHTSTPSPSASLTVNAADWAQKSVTCSLPLSSSLVTSTMDPRIGTSCATSPFGLWLASHGGAFHQSLVYAAGELSPPSH